LQQWIKFKILWKS